MVDADISTPYSSSNVSWISRVELALCYQLGKQGQMVRSYVAQKLQFSWIRNEVFSQHQRDHFAITEDGLATNFALQQLLPLTLIPVIDQHIDNSQYRLNVYTCHGSVLL